MTPLVSCPHDWPYLWLDATYLKVRQAGRIVSVAVTVAVAVNDQGRREVLGMAIGASEAETFWTGFLRSLTRRGLRGVKLMSQWLHKGLTDAGFEAVLMETRQVKGALKAMPIKTDRRDAEGIARLLQMGWFRPVHCKSVSSQEVRALLSSRKSVLNVLTDLELSLRGVLRNFGLKLGQVSKGRYEARVRELIAGNAMLEAAAEPILRARADLRRELAGLEKLVRRLAREDRVCRLLMTMPGVGHVIALTYTSAIDDPERFRRSKDVGPWVGLTPGRDQSGERDIVGAITKAGDAGLRTALYQAATVMLNHTGPNWLNAWALRLAKLRGKKRATIALARRIGVVLHRMWRDGTEFQFNTRRRDGASDSIGAAASHRQSARRKEPRLKVGDPPVSPRRDAVPDDARNRPCLPNRLIAFEHAAQIGTRESFCTRHEVGSRRADHGRKREPGEGHIRDRGSFSRPGRCCNRPTLNRSLDGTGNSSTTPGGIQPAAGTEASRTNDRVAMIVY